MGIYDREYVRVGPKAPSGLGNLRGWSFNTWLIVVNVLVFVVDALLGASGVALPVDMGAKYLKGATDQQQRTAVVTPVSAPPGLTRVAGLPGAVAVLAIDPMGETFTGAELGAAHFVPIGPNGSVVIRNNAYPVIGVHRFSVMPPLQALFHFSSGKLFRLEFWRLIGFQFLHGDLTHLLFNMLGLFFFGGMVEGYLGAKRYAAFYLVCGVFGAFTYMLLNALGQVLPQAPGLLFNDPYMPLVGASAGVFGVLMAAAFIAPTAEILLFFILPMKLRTAVYIFIAIAAWVLLTGGRNAGGQAAHLGGAAAGFYFIRHTHLLRDFFEIMGPGKKKGGKPRQKRVRQSVSDVDVDAILRKVHAQGLHSLNDAERRTLRRASEERRT